jgi:hypothetical protein
MGFFGLRQRIKSADLALVLLDQIFNVSQLTVTEHLHLSADKRDVFFQKVDYYKTAVVLRAVILEAQTDSRYETVQQELCKIIFSPDGKASQVEDMKVATLCLAELEREGKMIALTPGKRTV